VDCANVLLQGLLSEPAVSSVWVTDMQDLRLKIDGILNIGEGFRHWFQKSDVKVYVITCVWSSNGAVMFKGGAHWICLAIDTPPPPRNCTVRVFESLGAGRLNLDYSDQHGNAEMSVRASAVEAAQWISRLKYPDMDKEPEILVDCVQIPDKQAQKGGNDCGWRCALFIARDAIDSDSGKGWSEWPSELSKLHRCHATAGTIRTWLAEHSFHIDQDPESAIAQSHNSATAKSALEDLCQKLTDANTSGRALRATASRADEPPKLRLAGKVFELPQRKYWFVCLFTVLLIGAAVFFWLAFTFSQKR